MVELEGNPDMEGTGDCFEEPVVGREGELLLVVVVELDKEGESDGILCKTP